MLSTESRAQDFPTLAGMTYLNTAAEGIPPLCVRQALELYFADKQSGMDGRVAHFRQLQLAREQVATFFGLSAAEVAICSCTSEAYNLAALALRLQPGEEVVVNDLDFPAGVTPWLQAGSPGTVRVWRSVQGALRVEDLIPLLSPRTRLVTTSLVSFFNGFLLFLPEMIEAVRRHSPALVAVDVTQALGRMPLDLDDVDLIVSSTHKWILATHGGGLVGVPRRVAERWTVPAGGWFHLRDAFGPERFDRAVSEAGAASFAVGMPNFAAIYAIRAALEYIGRIGVERIQAAAQPLVEECRRQLRSLPIELLTPATGPLAGILAFRHAKAAEIHQHLHQKSIHVMAHAGRLRIAIHGYNDSKDVDNLLRELHAALQRV